MNKSLPQKISIAENILSNPDPDEYAKIIEFSSQHINEISSMPPYRMASIIKQKYAEAKMIPNPDMQALLQILELPEVSQIFTLMTLLPEKEKENLSIHVQTHMFDSTSMHNMIQTFKDGDIPWDMVKSALLEMIDSPDSSSYGEKLKKLLPTVFLTLSTMFTPVIGEKIIDNIWPDESTQEIQRLLQEQNDLERERIKIDRELLATIKSASLQNQSGSTGAFAPIQTAEENTQLQQAHTDNQMDISEMQLE